MHNHVIGPERWKGSRRRRKRAYTQIEEVEECRTFIRGKRRILDGLRKRRCGAREEEGGEGGRGRNARWNVRCGSIAVRGSTIVEADAGRTRREIRLRRIVYRVDHSAALPKLSLTSRGGARDAGARPIRRNSISESHTAVLLLHPLHPETRDPCS